MNLGISLVRSGLKCKTQTPRKVETRLIRSLFSAARIPFYVWASLVSQILIVVTGGVVRLTGSGLGCPTWPKCTAESLVNTPEMGVRQPPAHLCARAGSAVDVHHHRSSG
jgi:heme A synthase